MPTKSDKELSDKFKAEAPHLADLEGALRDMKQDDTQRVLIFLINELAALRARVGLVEKK